MGVGHGRHPVPLDHLRRVLESVRVGGRGVEGGGAPVGVDRAGAVRLLLWRVQLLVMTGGGGGSGSIGVRGGGGVG